MLSVAVVPYLPYRPTSVAHGRVSCSTCSVRRACLPHSLAESPDVLDKLAYARKRVKVDDVLYRMGSPFESLYAVRTGFFESRTAVADGREQVTGFHMPGDIVGMDGLANGVHAAVVIAIAEAEVCVIPRARLEDQDVQRHVHGAMTREIGRAHDMMLALGTLRAEERLAAFLVGFSQRMRSLGYARDDFNVRMSRLAIGSYLGLSLETVCRMLGRLRDAGLITVKQKRICIVDLPRLRSVCGITEARRKADLSLRTREA